MLVTEFIFVVEARKICLKWMIVSESRRMNGLIVESIEHLDSQHNQIFQSFSSAWKPNVVVHLDMLQGVTVLWLNLDHN